MILKSRQSWPEISATEHSSSGLLQPISMLSFTLPAEKQVEAHQHSWGQLMYAERGIIMVMFGGNTCITTPQRAVWIPPDIEHSVSSIEGAQLSSVYIDTDEIAELPDAPCLISVDPLLRLMIDRAIQISPSYEWSSSDGRFMRALRDEVMRSERDLPQLPMPKDTRLEKICQQLQINPGDKRTLKDWGEIVGASERTLSRLFHVEVALGFRQWKQVFRMDLSLELLRKQVRIDDLSHQLGYESASTFIAAFQKFYGSTPGEYARRYKN